MITALVRAGLCCSSKGKIIEWQLLALFRRQLALLLVIADKGISLMNIGQWCHHENASANGVMNIVEAHKKLHNLVFFLLLMMFIHQVADDGVFMCIESSPKMLEFCKVR
ncbi:hypothetical protein ACFX2I_027170 [Malus domestica]